MSESAMTRRQGAAWLLTAMLAPLAHASGLGWTNLALYAAAALPLWLLPGKMDGLPKPILLLEWGSVILAGASILPASGSYWPGRASEQVVPAVLLILAAMTGNVRRGANAAGILCWMTGILGAIVLYMGTQGIELRWLRPVPVVWNPVLAGTMLLPGLSVLWPEKPGKSMCGIAVLAAVLGVLVQGTLGAEAAEMLSAPFYEMARSLRLGSLSRLEPVGSVMLTLSWFALCLYLVMGARTLLEEAGIGEQKALWTGTVAMCLLIGMKETTKLPAQPLWSGILWFGIPLWNFFKKAKKDEKRC